MAIPAHRLALVLFIAGSFRYGFGQTTPADVQSPNERSDPAIYEQFFRQTLELRSVSPSSHMVTLNGQVQKQLPITYSRMQDVITLTVGEIDVLIAAADDCVSKIASLLQEARPLIFESRLQSAESGKISDAVTQQLKDLDDRHNRIVLDHVQGLKAALPDASFEKLDAYVRAPPEGKKPLTPTFGPRPVTQAAPK